MSVIIILDSPIKVGQDEQSDLTLRTPTVTDISELGYPFLVIPTENGTAMQIQVKTVLRYASRLAGVPPSSLANISIGDLGKIQTAVMDFFGDAVETPLSL